MEAISRLCHEGYNRVRVEPGLEGIRGVVASTVAEAWLRSDCYGEA